MKDFYFRIWGKNEAPEKTKQYIKYQKAFNHEIGSSNALRVFIACIMILGIEVILTFVRILNESHIFTDVLSVFSFLKLSISLAFIVFYLLSSKQMISLQKYYNIAVYLFLIAFGAIQIYLLYDDLNKVKVIYNFLYFLSIIAWIIILPPKAFFPLFITSSAAVFIIILIHPNSMELLDINLFSLIIFGIMVPISSVFLYRTSLRSYVNEQKLSASSYMDPLTGIFNRRGFRKRIQYLDEIMPEKSNIAVMMIDLDNFKLYNDTYGHDAGDQALIAVAQTFKEILPTEQEAYARYGGEEFAIVLYEMTRDEAEKMAENIRAAVADLKIFHRHSGEDRKYLSVSIGLITSTKNGATLTEPLLKLADINLYEAKSKGGNLVIATESKLN